MLNGRKNDRLTPALRQWGRPRPPPSAAVRRRPPPSAAAARARPRPRPPPPARARPPAPARARRPPPSAPARPPSAREALVLNGRKNDRLTPALPRYQSNRTHRAGQLGVLLEYGRDRHAGGGK